MITYYMTPLYVYMIYRFPLTRTYMGGANYLKLSQQIINAWKTAFTIPTENLKQRCLERATQVGRSHTFAIVAMIKSRILAATIQVSYSYHPVSVTFYGVP